MKEQPVLDRATSIMKSRPESHTLFVRLITVLARLNYKEKISGKAMEKGQSMVTSAHEHICEIFFGGKKS